MGYQPGKTSSGIAQLASGAHIYCYRRGLGDLTPDLLTLSTYVTGYYATRALWLGKFAGVDLLFTGIRYAMTRLTDRCVDNAEALWLPHCGTMVADPKGYSLCMRTLAQL